MKRVMTKLGIGGFLVVVLAGAIQASTNEQPLRERARTFERPAAVPHPPDNDWTPARAELGRTLFFDPRLSASSTVSCATCHNPSFDWGDGLAVGVGHAMKPLERRTPTILNLAWAEVLFWDGRALSLEEQALAPIQAEGEMNMPIEELVARLSAIADYAPLFERAYPGEGISGNTIAKALALFERTIVSPESPFDLWVAGDDRAIGPAAKRGFDLFTGKAGCNSCHAGWRFTDDSFYDIGVVGDDRGRGALMPDLTVVQHAFKTPTLRNVMGRAPYMHNGSEASIDEVIELYDKGGRVKRPSLSPEIASLDLTDDEKGDLIAFLESLTSVAPPASLPMMPR